MREGERGGERGREGERGGERGREREREGERVRERERERERERFPTGRHGFRLRFPFDFGSGPARIASWLRHFIRGGRRLDRLRTEGAARAIDHLHHFGDGVTIDTKLEGYLVLGELHAQRAQEYRTCGTCT